MSQWTHITGAVELENRCTILKHKAKKKERYEARDWFIPYPDEQIHFGKSLLNTYRDFPMIQMDVTIASLPIAKRIIERYITALPSGEHEIIKYFLNQDIDDCRSSSSVFSTPELKKIWEKEMVRRHSEWADNYKEFSKYTKNKLGWEKHCTQFTLTFSDDLRHCDGDELLVKLLEFFDKLKQEGIEIDSGTIQWYDEWKKHHYRVRFGAGFYEKFDEIWEVASNETGEVIASHKVERKWVKEGQNIYEDVTDTANWHEFASWKEENE